MLLKIQHNISDSFAKDITISFAKLFAKADYAGLHNLLSNDVYLVMDSGQIILFQTQVGETKIEVRLANESVWLTADQMNEL